MMTLRTLVLMLYIILCTTLSFATARSADDVWILAADPHVSGTANAEQTSRFATFCDAALSLPQRPAGVLWLGDNTSSRGLPGDYAMFAAMLAPLRDAGILIDTTLGDHDSREGLYAAAPWAVCPEDNPRLRKASLWLDTPPEEQRYVNVIETPHANWFLLDSHAPSLAEEGRLGERQLQWLAAELDARPDKPAILLAHHQLDTVPLACLVDTASLRQIVRDNPQVKAYIYGHTHVWMKMRRDGIDLVNIPALKTAFPKNAAATLGVRREVSAFFAVVTLRADGFTLVLHPLERGTKAPKTFEFRWQ